MGSLIHYSHGDFFDAQEYMCAESMHMLVENPSLASIKFDIVKESPHSVHLFISVAIHQLNRSHSLLQ